MALPRIVNPRLLPASRALESAIPFGIEVETPTGFSTALPDESGAPEARLTLSTRHRIEILALRITPQTDGGFSWTFSGGNVGGPVHFLPEFFRAELVAGERIDV